LKSLTNDTRGHPTNVCDVLGPVSAAEKGQQWKLAFEVLVEMKAAGHGANLIGYIAAISALTKGQQWHKALELFREIESSGGGITKEIILI
jgi:pentatricopeptide repeat protein